MFGVSTDYDRTMRSGRRDYLNVWSGPFMSVFEAEGVSLPKEDGYMLTTHNGTKIRVVCPCPRTDDTYEAVDAAISEALTAFYNNKEG